MEQHFPKFPKKRTISTGISKFSKLLVKLVFLVKRRRGRPKTTWRRTVEKERAEAGWRSWEEGKTEAANRDKWRDSVKALCATRHKEDRWGNRPQIKIRSSVTPIGYFRYRHKKLRLPFLIPRFFIFVIVSISKGPRNECTHQRR